MWGTGGKRMLIKDNIRDPDANIVYLDCMNVNILVVIFNYRFARC